MHTIDVDVGVAPVAFQGQKLAKVHFHGFSDLDSAKGKGIDSNPFDCFNHKWKVRLYPGGSSRAEDGMVSVGLRHLSYNEVTIYFNMLIKDSEGNMRKRKIQSQIQDEESQIKILDEQLTEEVNRLDEAKRAKRVFDAHLENARNSPVSVLYEETQCDILPVPRYRPETGNESEWKYSLLGDSAEVHFTFGDISASKPVEQLRCHIRDGGASIKLLQALLLGNIDAYESSGPFPLRESLTTCILQQDGLDDQILLMSFLFSRIDALVRSVRELETNSFCKVIQSPKSGDDVILSISMSHEGTVIQFWFLFEKLSSKDWQVKTVPSDVKVSIVSTTQDMSALGSQLQDNAQHILAGSSSSDPILMRTICGQVLKCFVEAMTG